MEWQGRCMPCAESRNVVLLVDLIAVGEYGKWYRLYSRFSAACELSEHGNRTAQLARSH